MSGVARSGTLQNVRKKLEHECGNVGMALSTTTKISLYSLGLAQAFSACSRIYSSTNAVFSGSDLKTEAFNLTVDALKGTGAVTFEGGKAVFNSVYVISDYLLNSCFKFVDLRDPKVCMTGFREVNLEMIQNLPLREITQKCQTLDAPLDAIVKIAKETSNTLDPWMPSSTMIAVAATIMTGVAIYNLMPAYEPPKPPKPEPAEILTLDIVLPTETKQLSNAAENWDLEISLPETSADIESSRKNVNPNLDILEINDEWHVLSALRHSPFQMQCRDGKTRNFKNVVAATLAQKYSSKEMDLFQEMKAAYALSYAKARDGNESPYEAICQDGKTHRFKNIVAATLAQNYSISTEIEIFENMTVAEALLHENISGGNADWDNSQVKKIYRKDKKSRAVRDVETKKPLIEDVKGLPLRCCDVWLMNALSANFQQHPDSYEALKESEDHQLNHQIIGKERLVAKGKTKSIWGGNVRNIEPNHSFDKINDLLHYIRDEILINESFSARSSSSVQANSIRNFALTEASFNLVCQDGKTRTFKNIIAAVLAQKYYRFPEIMKNFEAKSSEEALSYDLALGNSDQRVAENARKRDLHWYNSYVAESSDPARKEKLRRCDVWLFNVLSAYLCQHPEILAQIQATKKSQLYHSLISDLSGFGTFDKINGILHYIREQSLKEPTAREEPSPDRGVPLNGPVLLDHTNVSYNLDASSADPSVSNTMPNTDSSPMDMDQVSEDNDSILNLNLTSTVTTPAFSLVNRIFSSLSAFSGFFRRTAPSINDNRLTSDLFNKSIVPNSATTNNPFSNSASVRKRKHEAAQEVISSDQLQNGNNTPNRLSSPNSVSSTSPIFFFSANSKEDKDEINQPPKKVVILDDLEGKNSQNQTIWEKNPASSSNSSSTNTQQSETTGSSNLDSGSAESIPVPSSSSLSNGVGNSVPSAPATTTSANGPTSINTQTTNTIIPNGISSHLGSATPLFSSSSSLLNGAGNSAPSTPTTITSTNSLTSANTQPSTTIIPNGISSHLGSVTPLSSKDKEMKSRKRSKRTLDELKQVLNLNGSPSIVGSPSQASATINSSIARESNGNSSSNSSGSNSTVSSPSSATPTINNPGFVFKQGTTHGPLGEALDNSWITK